MEKVDAHRGKFDLVFFWSLDRFSREGVLETLQHLEKLNSYGVDWKSYTEEYLDSCGVFREAIIGVIAAIAKQERVRRSEAPVRLCACAPVAISLLTQKLRIRDWSRFHITRCHRGHKGLRYWRIR